MKRYRNRVIINQRGGSIDINNTTDNESIQMSHRSGSNILLNNLTNSELATNNKQTDIIYDEFKTVGNDNVEYIGRDKITRVVRNTYDFKGFENEEEIAKYKEWRELYRPVALDNSQFRTLRGGMSIPNGVETPQEKGEGGKVKSENEDMEVGLPIGGNKMEKTEGEGKGEKPDRKEPNPTTTGITISVNASLSSYNGTPMRTSTLDEVINYTPITPRNEIAGSNTIGVDQVEAAAGADGSQAPGVMKYGAEKSASTEEGGWKENETATTKLTEKITELYKTTGSDDEPEPGPLLKIEMEMGDGGDEILTVKRNKFETVGAVINDYPSTKIDPEGRSQPFEVLVSDIGIFKNHDAVPHVEEVDNSSMFPCGNDIKIVGNSYKRTVGSGGVDIKTSGTMELGGSVVTIAGTKLNINASHGIQMGSAEGIDLHSLKTITLRTNRQVYVESSMGVRNNLIVGGGLAVEGETYIHHITAPVEIQQTEDMVLCGKFNTETPRTLLIGECLVGDVVYPVYALPSDDLILNYPHSHHFKNLPLTLKKSNTEVRTDAMNNGINKHDKIAQASGQLDARKLPELNQG